MRPLLHRAMGGLVLLLALAAAAPRARAAPQDAPPPPAPAPAPKEGRVADTERPSAPVVVWNRTVMELRAVYPPRTLEQRAADVVARIESIPAEHQEKPVDVQQGAVEGQEQAMLSVDGRLIVLLSREDLPAGTTLQAYAQEVAGRVREVLLARRDQFRASTILRGLGYSLAALVGAIFLLWCMLRLRRALEGPLLRFAGAHPIPVAGVDTTPLLRGIVRLLSGAIVFAAGAVTAYLFLAFSLEQFPYSAPIGRRLAGYFLGVLSDLGSGILNGIPGLFMAGVILYLARLVNRAQGAFLQGVIDGRIVVSWLDPEPARATRRLATLLIWAFAFVCAYPYIPGSSTEAFKGVSVLLGLMLSVGSAGVLHQSMSGLVVTYSRALRPGDWVSVGDVEGSVLVVGVLSTKIATPRGEEVSIPNAVLVSGRIVNYSRLAKEKGAMLTTKVTIGYDAPWRVVHRLLLGAAAAVPLVKKEPPSFVLQRALSDFYVEYELFVHHDRPEDRWQILSDLHAAIQDQFNAAGVQIMSPNFLSQPDKPVLVPKDRWDGDGPPPAKP